MGGGHLVLTLFALLSLSCLFPPPAAAGGSGDLIGGAEADTEGQSFSYLGGGITTPMGRDYYLTGRVFAGYLRYKFESGGKVLTAEVPVAIPSIGIKYQKEGFAFVCSLGGDFREIRKETASGGEEKNSEAGASIQAEAYMWGAEKKSLELMASYSTIDDFFWTRGRVKKGVLVLAQNTDLKVGAELAGMGNSDFSAAQAGALAEFYVNPSNLSVLFKVGYKDTSASNGAGYAGVEVYYGF